MKEVLSCREDVDVQNWGAFDGVDWQRDRTTTIRMMIRQILFVSP